MRSLSSAAAILLLLAAPAWPADAPPDGLVEVTGTDVNLRSGPSVDFHSLGHAQKGDLVRLVGTDGDWRRAQLPGGPVVQVFAALVTWEDGALRGTVAADDVLMRATPSQAYFPVHDQRLRRGEDLVVLESVDGTGGAWLHVVAPERVHVWIHGKYVRSAEGVPADLEGRWKATASARVDALTGGRLAAERARATSERTDVVAGALAEIEARVATGVHRAEDAERAEGLAAQATDATQRTRARDLAKRIRGVVAAARLAAAKRRAAEAAADAERRQRALERREAEYERKMKELDGERAKERPAPTALGKVFRKAGRLLLVTDGGESIELRSLRFRLDDYVGRSVRVWGARSARDGQTDRLDVSSVEIR